MTVWAQQLDVLAGVTFQPLDIVHRRVREACEACGGTATCEVIGVSEQGREMLGVSIGRGDRRVSLIAGSHADEPVGTRTLLHLIETVCEFAGRDDDVDALLDRVTFVIVPHVNPDGEAANRAWVERWPDPLAYLSHVVREPPGRDVEFGYPNMRAENTAIAAWLRRHAPLAMHVSMHGMAVAEGGMLLIERGWIDRTDDLRQRYATALRNAGIGLHDHDRGGEKGFEYIGPGFATTPRGQAMREYFERQGDNDTASLFHDSSMEFARSLGGDPLCLVTEIPLWRLTRVTPEAKPGVPETYLAFRRKLPELQAWMMRGETEALRRAMVSFGVEPVGLRTAMALQLRAIELGLRTATTHEGDR